MTFLELQTRVIQKLAETASPKFWTLQEIKDNLNRGCREIVKKTEFNVTTTALSASGSGWALPSGLLIPKAVYYYGKKLDQTSADYLDGISTTWRTGTGTPVKWLLDSGVIKLFPVPVAGSPTITMRYVAAVATLSADSDVPAFPSEYHDALVHWALFECFSRDGDGQDLAKSNLYAGLFKKLSDEFSASINQFNLVTGTWGSSNDFNALIERVTAKLSEAPTPKKWNLDEVKYAINRGMKEFARQSELTTTTIWLSPGAESIFPIPDGMLTPKAIYFNGFKLDQTTADYLDGVDSAWRDVIDTPRLWLLFMGGIRLYPNTFFEGPAIELRYVPKPTELVYGSDVPEVQAEYLDAVIDWAVFDCLSRDADEGNQKLGQTHLALFQKMVGEISAANDLSLLTAYAETDNTFGSLIYRAMQTLKKFGGIRAFPIDTIKMAINHGYRRFLQETSCFVGTASLDYVGGGYYQMPGDILFPKTVYYDGKELDQTNQAFLDGQVGGTGSRVGVIGEGGKMDADWRSATGDASLWLFENGYIRLYPAPEWGHSITMNYIPVPTLMKDPWDEPTMVPPGFREAIIYWAVQECLVDNPKAARQVAAEMEKFSSMVNDCKVQFMPPLVKLPAVPFLV